MGQTNSWWGWREKNHIGSTKIVFWGPWQLWGFPSCLLVLSIVSCCPSGDFPSAARELRHRYSIGPSGRQISLEWSKAKAFGVIGSRAKWLRDFLFRRFWSVWATFKYLEPTSQDPWTVWEKWLPSGEARDHLCTEWMGMSTCLQCPPCLVYWMDCHTMLSFWQIIKSAEPWARRSSVCVSVDIGRFWFRTFSPDGRGSSLPNYAKWEFVQIFRTDPTLTRFITIWVVVDVQTNSRSFWAFAICYRIPHPIFEVVTSIWGLTIGKIESRAVAWYFEATYSVSHVFFLLQY